MTHDVELAPDVDLERASRGRRAARMAFQAHATTYVLVNVLLVLIWAVVGGQFWPIWPMIGWGFGVAVHAVATYGFSWGRAA